MEEIDYWKAATKSLKDLASKIDLYVDKKDKAYRDTPKDKEVLENLSDDISSLYQTFQHTIEKQSEIAEVLNKKLNEGLNKKVVNALQDKGIWHQLGIVCEIERTAWEGYDFSAEEAASWRANNFSPNKAFLWKKSSSRWGKRYEPQQAKQWVEANFRHEDAWVSSWEPKVALRFMEDCFHEEQLKGWSKSSNRLLDPLFHFTDSDVIELIKMDFLPQHLDPFQKHKLTAKQIMGFWKKGMATPESHIRTTDSIPGDIWPKIKSKFAESPFWGEPQLRESEEDKKLFPFRKILVVEYTPSNSPTSHSTIEFVFNVVGEIVRAIVFTDEKAFSFSHSQICEFIETQNRQHSFFNSNFPTIVGKS